MPSQHKRHVVGSVSCLGVTRVCTSCSQQPATDRSQLGSSRSQPALHYSATTTQGGTSALAANEWWASGSGRFTPVQNFSPRNELDERSQFTFLPNDPTNPVSHLKLRFAARWTPPAPLVPGQAQCMSHFTLLPHTQKITFLSNAELEHSANRTQLIRTCHV
jgi:hypothetical protein